MIKSRKMILGTLGTMAIVAAPIAAVVSCGTTKSKEIEISALDKALMAVSKPKTIDEFKASLIKSITDNFSKDDKKTEFDSTKDFKAINEAKTKEAMLKAASEMTAWTKAKEAVNTVITIDGADYVLKTYVMMPTFGLKTPGSAKTEAAAEILATKADEKKLNEQIDAAETKKDIKAIFVKFSADNKNKEQVDMATIDAIKPEPKNKDKAIKEQKAAAKKLAANVFNRDYKAATKAVEEVKTIVTVGGSEEVTLNNFVKDPQSTFKVKTPGNPKLPATEGKVHSTMQIVTLDTYKAALIKVIQEFKDGESTPFKNADIKKISEAKTVSEALAAAKAVKAPATDKKVEEKTDVKAETKTTKGTKETAVKKPEAVKPVKTDETKTKTTGKTKTEGTKVTK